MKTIQICKAQPTHQEVESISVVIDSEVPNFPTIESAKVFYRNEAQKLADVLFNALPGGTVDALLVEMMRQKVSLFSIPYGASEKQAS